MATPIPRSYPQILGGMFSNITANLGIKKLKPGSGLLTLLEAAAQSDVRQSQDVFKALQSVNLDNCTGFELDQVGAAEKLPRRKKQQATGFITITDTSFTKTSSEVYHGRGAPIVGTIYLYVAQSPTFNTAPSTGSLYLGRGTANYEGPLAYTAKTNSGTYWTLTLSSPTTMFHNQGEAVILAQGGARNISAGQTVSLPQGALTNQATYTVTTAATIPDGETEVDSVLILAIQAGTGFNCTDGAITTFVGGPPFTGATVTNPLPITNGTDTESDNTYRERIRQARNNKSRGIDRAIIDAVIDVTSPQEPGSVTSASLTNNKTRQATLFIDDGTGYEAKSSGVGFEVVVDAANGGETEFFTVYSPIAQATVETQNEAPYYILDGMQLIVSVGEVETTHTFSSNDFATPQVASAYEIVSSINANSTINFVAKVAGNGTTVQIHSVSETLDQIQVIAGPIPANDANTILGFSTALFDTTSLYINDTELSKDGSLAKIASNSFSVWSSMSSPQTLTINVDNTGPVTYTFTNTDFINAGYGSLNNATTTVWANVINNKIPGITAAIENDTVTLTSNRGRSSVASVTISGGSMATNYNVFPVTSSQGNNFDYSIDRSVGSIVLENPLTQNDHLTLGTVWPEAFLQSQYLNNSTTTNLLANRSYWLSVDDPNAVPIPFSGVNPTINSSINALTPYATKVALDIATCPCIPGDLILFTDENFDSSWRGVFRTEGTNQIIVERKGANVCRFAHTATWAPITVNSSVISNAVVVCGGLTTVASGIGSPGALKGRGITNTVEYYDPSTGNWGALPNMLSYRAYHTATKLSNGNILVCGGFDATGIPLATTEIFNTTTLAWSSGPTLLEAKAHHTATVLSSTNVLIVGGINTVGASTMTFEYSVSGNNFVNQHSLNAARYGHQALLVGTTAMVFGGISVATAPAVPIASVEAYSGTWTTKAPMSSSRAFFGAANTNNSKVLVMGNGRRTGIDNTPNDAITNQTTYDVYNVAGNTWAGATTIYNTGGSVTVWNQGDVISSFTSGKILAGYAANGIVSNGYSNTQNLYYDSVGNTFSLLSQGQLALTLSGREGQVGVALQAGTLNDSVLYIGGISTSSTTTGNSASVDGGPISAIELYNFGSSSWSFPYDSFSSFALSRSGVKAVRSLSDIKQITIPANNNYTANTLASALNSATNAAISTVYKTTSFRINTPSLDGSLLLVDEDPNLLTLSPIGTLINSQRSQFATTISNSGLCTPADFQIFTAESSEGTLIDVPPYTPINGTQPTCAISNGNILGLKNYITGYTNNTQLNWGNALGYKSAIQSINNAGTSFTEIDGTQRITKMTNEITARTALPIIPGNAVALMTPFSLTPFDTLTITVDGNTDTKRFTIPFGRKVMPTNSSYQTPLSLLDADNNNNTLATAFGTIYDFNDFVIYSRARTITDSSDATKRILWRYYRYGAEGNACAIRYVYPTKANQAANVVANSVQSKFLNNGNYYYSGQLQTTLDVNLPSGAARPNSKMSNNTTLGFAGTTTSADQTVGNAYIISGYKCLQINTRTLNGSTTIRLQLPGAEIPDSTVTSLGVSAGNVLWFNATVPSSATLQTGQFTVASTSVPTGGYQEITIAPYTLNDGTAIASPLLNPGDVSRDSTQRSSFDTSVVVGDYITLGKTVTTGSYTVAGNTMRITAIGPTNQYVKASFVDAVNGPIGQYQTTPQYLPLTSIPGLAIFASSTTTATSMASAINSLSNQLLTATVTGTGTGNLTLSSWEGVSPQSSTNRFILSDGVNYVKNTNQPANNTIQTTFDLKLPINANLVSNNDFTNEIFYLSPALPQDVVEWFNTPAITGLWSVANISLTDNGTTVQINTKTAGSAGSVLIEGGSANISTAAMIGTPQISVFNQEDILSTQKAFNLVSTVITVPTSSTVGLTGGTWVSLNNTTISSKVNDFTTTWGNNNALTSIKILNPPNALFTFGGTVQTTFSLPVLAGFPPTSVTLVDFQKIGNYVAVNIPRMINQGETRISSIFPGDYLQITTSQGSQSNLGIFNIVRVTNNETYWTIWIKNSNAVQETTKISAVGIRADSIVPGDSIVINNTDFGVQNKGTWTVSSVSSNVVQASFSGSTPIAYSGPGLNTTVERINIVTQNPLSGIRKLIGVSLNPGDANSSDLLLLEEFNPNASGSSSHPYCTIPWSQANGTVISALDKLGYDQALTIGNDAYRYNTGLIAECKRVIYGDDADPDNYPGYAANGSSIVISGPTIKRIQVTLSVRLQSNITNDDIAGQIASAVAAIINGSPVGVNLPISNIITAAQSVDGVQAVSIISPAYDAVNDQILVRGQEKPLVVNIEQDVKVIFAGV